MRIAFISTMQGYVWGGCEELWFEAAREALKKDYQVIASVGHWCRLAPKLRTLKDAGVRVYFQPLPRSMLGKSDFARRIVSKFRQITSRSEGFAFLPIKKFKPDIICISQANTYDIMRFPHLRDFLSKANIPYAILCHGHEDIPLPDELTRTMITTHFQKAVWVGMVAQALLTQAERHTATRIENGFVIRNPVNLKEVSDEPFPETEEVFRFACVGRLESYQKGQDILFEALSGKVWQNRNWRLSLAGEGVHLEYLQKLAAHYGIADKIDFLGHITHIRQIWATHHLLILPSRYEGMPLALVEAMLCGRSAVVSDVAGNAEWIEDGVNGFIAEAASAKSLAKALERAWEKRFDWRKYGESARRTALEKYQANPGGVLVDLLAGQIASGQI